MNKCETCSWKYRNIDGDVNGCVCDDDTVFESDTQFTDKCIGYLDENFETNMIDLYDECVELLSNKQYEKLLLAKEYLKKL